jgi:hypothetical protein
MKFVLPWATSRSFPAKKGNDNNVALDKNNEIMPSRNTHRYGSTKRKTPSNFRRLDAVILLFSPSSRKVRLAINVLKC